MNTIGKNREGALSSVITNTGEFAVPLYSSSMTAEQVYANSDIINKQIEFWGNEISKLKFGLFSGDKAEADNISKMIEIQSQRLMPYYDAMAKLEVTPPVETPGITPGETPGVYETPSPNYTPLLLGGAALVALILYQKNKKRKVAGKKDEWIVPVGIGAALILLMKNKKEDIPVTVQEKQPNNTETPVKDLNQFAALDKEEFLKRKELSNYSINNEGYLIL